MILLAYMSCRLGGDKLHRRSDREGSHIARAEWLPRRHRDRAVGRPVRSFASFADRQSQAKNRRDAVFSGFQLGDNDQFAKQTNFEHATRIPLIVHVPGQVGGTRADQLVEAVVSAKLSFAQTWLVTTTMLLMSGHLPISRRGINGRGAGTLPGHAGSQSCHC